jgi:hypothetical protein
MFRVYQHPSQTSASECENKEADIGAIRNFSIVFGVNVLPERKLEGIENQ